MTSHQIPQSLNDKLWPHQKRAINFALRYLRQPFEAEVALIRMPTGTGKTGVIAALSVALPPPQWTLVLTPWKNLCRQMILDLESRFWRSRGWRPQFVPNVAQLYPRIPLPFLLLSFT
jgi:superfamily II DNA or RNA helicase